MRYGIRLKHIKIVTKANGRRYVYFSQPGMKRTPLPDLPENHPEFLRAYTAAQQGAEPVSRGNAKAGTIAALVASSMVVAIVSPGASVRKNGRRRLAPRRSYDLARMSMRNRRHDAEEARTDWTTERQLRCVSRCKTESQETDEDCTSS